MKKYIIGAIVGAVTVLGGYAFAARTVTVPDDITVVDVHQVGKLGTVYKVYDSSTNTVCYVYTMGGISCLKNI
jgi:hypothetical protein